MYNQNQTKLNGHWLDNFNNLSKSKKSLSLNESDKSLNLEHDRILKERLLEFQSINQPVGISAAAEISLEAMEKAHSKTSRGFLSNNQGLRLEAVISESFIDLQEFYTHDGQLYNVAMITFDINNLKKEDIKILNSIFEGFDYEIFTEQGFAVITSFRSLNSSFFSKEHIDRVINVYHRRTIDSLFQRLLSMEIDVSYKKYSFIQKIKDWMTINFNR